MRQNMDMNFEQTLTISLYFFIKAYGTFVVPFYNEKMNAAFNEQILRFLLQDYSKYVIAIFSFHWFCVVAAAHSVVTDSLCI